MKSISLRMIPACLVFVPFLISCGAEPITGDTPTNPMIAIRSDIDAKAYRQDQDGFQSSSAAGATVDSLEVNSAALIMSGWEIHGIDENSLGQISQLRSNQTVV